MADRAGPNSRPILKRPRPVLSCLECRRKKLKCDRLLPCQQCLKLNQPSLCTYAPGQEPESREEALESDSSGKRTRHSTTDTSELSSELISDLQDRVRRLEGSLRAQQQTCSRASSEPQNHCRVPTTRSVQGPEIVDRVAPEPAVVHRDFSIYDQFEDALRFQRSLKQRHREEKIRTISSRLFTISQAIAVPNATGREDGILRAGPSALISRMAELLPEPQVRGKLLTLYFENFHHCARLLHRPSFLLQNQRYNQGVLESSELPRFIPVLLGVLSVASSLNTFPECEVLLHDSGRDDSDAIWLIEEWYGADTRNNGLTLSALQAMALAVQARRAQRSNLANLWASSALVVRHAMTLALHRQPDPATNAVESEVRRCLWLTILEQDLALSISNEMPAFGVTFDPEPPSNINDDDISVFTQSFTQRPPDQWTDGLCQHILGKSFNERLKAYTFRLSQGSSAVAAATHYTRLTEHVRTLESILQNLPPLFRLGHMTDHAANTPGRLMAQMELDISLRRPLIATCTPYARLMPADDAYRDVRIPWVQSHLVVMCFQDLFDPKYPAIDVPKPRGYWDFFFTNYRYDLVRSVEAMLLEGRFLKRLEEDKPTTGAVNDNVVTSSQMIVTTASSSSASSIKTMPWNFSAMLKSVEDSLEPMSRRVGKCGGELRDIVRHSVLYYCLTAPGSGDAADESIVNGLLGLIEFIEPVLVGEGYSIQGESSERMDTVEWFAEFLGMV